VPVDLSLVPKRVADRAYDPRWNRYVQNRVTGDFTGTTDQIFQWAAVKWGLPDNVLRVVALMESDWMQSNFGDNVNDPAECPEAAMPLPCPVTYGIVGVRSTSWQGLYPWNRDSTAAAVDVFAGWLRGCYEGWVWWLRDHGNQSRGTYRAGDLWGCVGAWFSGDWHEGQVGVRSGEDYMARAREFVDRPPWLLRNF
jgi:autotransporter family porin